MNRAALAVLRAVQFAYPAEFRRRFGAELTQLAVDRQRHGGVAVWRVVWSETYDAARAAPALRWESNVTRVVVVSVLAAVAIVAAMAVKLLLIPVVLIALACWFSWSHAWRPVAATQPRRWIRWLVAGAASIAVAIAIPAIDGGELNGFWWSAAAVALLGGVSMIIAGLLLATSSQGTTRATGLG